MDELFYFACVNFVYDPKLPYFPFWYLCEFEETKEGDWIIAPLGPHDRLQYGIVIETRYATAENAPYPMDRIKCIKELKKESRSVQNCK